MEHLVRSCYKQGGYVFAKKAEDLAKDGIKNIARLASNENPDPPSPNAIKAAKKALVHANRYPDEKADLLTQALRAYYGDYSFITGVGMDGVIETVIRTLVDPGDTVAVSTPTFSFYALAATAQGAKVVPVLRERDYSVNVQKLVQAAKTAKITFLCSPNNPTGNATSLKDVRKVLNGIGGILFLDNAYVEFSGLDYLPLLKEYDNLIIGKTFSKVHSLAGLRIGYGFVPAWFQPFCQRAGTPFTVNTVSAAAAAGALSDKEHTEKYIDHVRKWRDKFGSDVKFKVLHSDANFVMVDVSPKKSDEVVESLARQGVLVRSCRSFSGLPDHYIRVSVGEDWENERFIEVVNSL